MIDTGVLSEPTMELPSPQALPEVRAESSALRKKPRRAFANLRFNGLRYVTLSGCILAVWGLFHAAIWFGTGKPEGTFMLVLAGGMLAAAAKTGIDLLSWAEANRQAIHVERVRAIRRVFDRALAVRETAILDWRRIHTVLVDNLEGRTQAIRLFRDHDEADREGEALLRKALSEEFWIRPAGVDAIRRFKSEIAAIDYLAIATESEFLQAFNAHLDEMRCDVALAAIGIPLD